MLSTVSRDNLKHEERIYWGLFLQQRFFPSAPSDRQQLPWKSWTLSIMVSREKGDVALRLWAGNKVGLGDLGGHFQGQGSWDHMG